MTVWSPYLLNESPQDLALTLGQVNRDALRDNTEMAEVAVYVDGVLRYTTGSIAINSLENHLGGFTVHRRNKTSIEAVVRVNKQINGSIKWAKASAAIITGPTSLSGQVRVIVDGRSSQISRLVKQAKSSLARSAQRSRSKSSFSRKSSTPRPSPEIINRQFLQVAEVGNRGILQPAQSGRSVIPVLSYKREWTGTVTPGYGSKKTRQLPDNPHTVKITEVGADRYVYSSVNTSTEDHSLDLTPYSTRIFVPGELDYTFLIERADHKAIQRLIGKAQAGIQANIAQTLAQSNLLLKMIIGNATAITKSIRQLKRGNIPGAISALNSGQRGSKMSKGTLSPTKSVASNWLQLQYGWKPLLSDIQGLFKLLPNLTSPTGYVQQAKSSASDSHEHSVNYPPSPVTIQAHNGLTNHHTRITVKYGIRFKVEDQLQAFLSQTGFTDPISLTWELLPFSFVADWFLPIGAYLEQRKAFHGLQFMGGYKVVFRRTKMESRISYGGPVNGVPQTIVNFGAQYSREVIELSRGPITNWPSAVFPSTFTGNPFSKSNIFGSGSGTNERASNAIALLIQAFK